jgi:RHS repeat-associated protein
MILGLNDYAWGTFTLTNTWQRYTLTFSSISSLAAGSFTFEVRDSSPGTTAYFWGAQTEQAATAGSYIATGPSTETLHYYSTDHLGTTTIVTDAAGGLQNDSDYYPYGTENPITAAVGNHYKFTGYEHDDGSGETDNDYAMARYYNSISGRFMSPDPFDGSMDAGNPQSFNR